MRSSQRLLCTAALVVAAVTTSWAVESGPVRSVDNIPPAPVTELRALNTGDEVLVTWTQSVDDAVSFTPAPTASVTSTATFGDAIVPRGGVNGYRVYRTVQGESADGPLPGVTTAVTELIGIVSPGSFEYIDAAATTGITYIYSVKPFDADNETDPAIEPGSADDLARIISLGGQPPDVVVVTRVQSQMTFDAVIDVEDEAAVEVFVTDFITLLANLLGIDPARISVTSVTAGSIVVDFEILDVEGADDEHTAAEALENLLVLVEDDTADEFATIGPVLQIEDKTSTDTVVIPQPVDAEGNVILGWFTRGGNQVGLDDFFAFAENFGRTDASPEFDSTFDIVPNGAVDLDDFFAFAEYFGKIVANASEIKDLLNQ